MWSCSTGGHAQPEQARLAEVVVERRRRLAHLGAGRDRPAARRRRRRRASPATNGQPPSSEFGRYGATPPCTALLVQAVAQHVVDRRVRPVDRDLGEVRAAEPGELGVEVGEQPRLQQRVVGDVDAGHEVAGVERDLLGLGEEVGRVAVERQQADRLHRRELLGHELGRVEQVDALEGLVGGVREDLDAELPLREGAGLDRVVRGRGGGSRGRCRRASAPPPTPGECTPSDAASSGT